MHIPILFEDQDLLVINKPPGVVANRADTHHTESLQDWLEGHLTGASQAQDWETMIPAEFAAEFGSPTEVWAERVGLVHRLDKDTSGVLILAKNPGSLVNLLHQFKTRQVSKQYTCLTHGKFGMPEAKISFPIGRASQNRQHFTVKADGREAVTEYRVTAFYPGLDLDKLAADLSADSGWDLKQLKRRMSIYEGFSLVECKPQTGRTHQIRVHMTHLKHPLVGDLTYLGKKRQTLDPLWCSRHFLHASQITFTHPRSGEVVTVQAPLPEDLEKALGYLLPAS